MDILQQYFYGNIERYDDNYTVVFSSCSFYLVIHNFALPSFSHLLCYFFSLTLS